MILVTKMQKVQRPPGSASLAGKGCVAMAVDEQQVGRPRQMGNSAPR